MTKAAPPARLDRVAARVTPVYLHESLLETSKVIAKGFERYKVSPMPPQADIFKPQELADLEAYLLSLR